ncbi:uncharacterized protein DUF2784 [Tamilnaduibacter salinus]|uniref:Uncharacterized protein DUF2784 n=1 Tax=Tamilnaduibacter salinus TaxID=1484056 RepID=A0A2A2I4S0_9GAMM|nr:DUF2784 domain-containing protein [Tamilnaduibacter salinus]PAV26657.1 hypothetical protein CF392_04645 [Tamilnaduibacter salinus]PVY77537.1 uncharacterized protein DUF2784 [Tamilnaduibacter salinus]
MVWQLAAEAVLVVHLLFIIFAVFGGLLGLWRRWLIVLHLPAVAWASLLMINGWLCPLTPLEITLRQWAGQTGFEGSFIGHYLVSVIYPSGLTRTLQTLLGVGVGVFNVGVYGVIGWRGWRKDNL